MKILIPLKKFSEVILYVLGVNESADGLEIGWLDSLTGKVHRDDSHEGESGFLRVAFCIRDEDDAEDHRPSQCPKCNGKLALASFTTKGNEPFYNVVARQFELQQGSKDPEELKENPNAGKKVILFSTADRGQRESPRILLTLQTRTSLRKFSSSQLTSFRNGLRTPVAAQH